MLNTKSIRANILCLLSGNFTVLSDDFTLLLEVAKTEEWSGCQGNTTKEERLCHTQKSELDPVGNGESLRDLSCTLYINWR